jgi:hypothetical protein
LIISSLTLSFFIFAEAGLTIELLSFELLVFVLSIGSSNDKIAVNPGVILLSVLSI